MICAVNLLIRFDFFGYQDLENKTPMALSPDRDDKKIPLLRTVVGSWYDALRVIEDVGILFAIVVTVLLGLNYVGVTREWGHPAPDYQLLGALSLFLGQPFVLTALAIAVHRTLLLQRTDLRFFADYRQYLQFFGYVVLLLGLCQVPMVLLDLDLSNETVTWRTGIATVLLVAILALLARILIFFPALAIHAPGARMGNALRDSQGHGGRIMVILICALMPLLAVGAIVFDFLEDIQSGPFGTFLTLETRALGAAIATTVVAATASRLYSSYADSLGWPANLNSAEAVRSKEYNNPVRGGPQ
jgi:hypothetical protein